MPTSKVTVRIPQITSLETAIRLYYERSELSTPDIRELFGPLANDTVSRLKRKARELMNERGKLPGDATRVNTEIAYEAWGLDITKLEFRLNKLRTLGGEVMTEDKQQAICNALLSALKLTREGADIASLEYSQERETVTIMYSDGITPINIATECGIMMILDIVLALA